jgi:hypothetical protein
MEPPPERLEGELEGGGFAAKLKAVREREAAGTMTKGDIIFLKTRKAQAATAGENDAAIPPPTEPPQKRNGPAKRMRKAMAMTVVALMTRKRKTMAKTS